MAQLDEMKTFVDGVETGSLSAASRRSGLALSAVSRRLKDLEARLGTSLVQRSTRRFNVTEDGETYFRHCRKILDDIDLAEADMHDRAGEVTGRIRMTAPQSFAALHLADTIGKFLEEHPRVSLDLDLSDRRVDLLEEGCDLAIRIGALSDSALIARRLTRIRHVPCASPKLLEHMGRPTRPEDLAQYPALAYRSRGGRAHWSFVRPDGSAGSVNPEARLWASNGDFLCQQAIAGLGVIVEPTFITARYLSDRRLVPLFPDHTWSDNAAFAVFPNAVALPRRVRAIIEHIADALTMDAPWDRRLRAVYPELEWDTR